MGFFGTTPMPEGHLYIAEPIGGSMAVFELDALVLVMCILSCIHAYKNSAFPLVIAGLGLGVVTEHASLRLGGTHCHQSGLINISECSSANSVFYYLPWVYACVTLARRLVDENSWSFPLITGLLFFGMCGVYESQGPSMGWWLWPQPDLVVKAGCDIAQFGIPAADSRGLVASQHAYDALFTRQYGVPATAPYFHFAFGWGIAFAFQLVRHSNTLLAAIVCVIGGPAIALVWDPPIRILNYLIGVDQMSAVVSIMALALAMPMFLGVPLKTGQPKDGLLFAIVLCNEAFFLHNALLGRGADVLPPALKLFVASVAIGATAAYGRAAGMWSASLGAKDPLASLSWFDRLQKQAQESEMDADNTPSLVFLVLSAIQPPVVKRLADFFGVPVALGWLPIASHTLMFGLSHYVLRTDKFFDITGETTFFPLILYSFLSQCAGTPFEAAPRQLLITGVALVWCTRLGLFLGIRIFVRGSDWRFEKLMSGAAYNLFGWVCQGTWIFLTGLCVWLCHAAPAETASTPLNPLDYAGATVAVIGIAIAHVRRCPTLSVCCVRALVASIRWHNGLFRMGSSCCRLASAVRPARSAIAVPASPSSPFCLPLPILRAAARAHFARARLQIADMQKSKWNRKYESGMQKTWIEEGLWRWSRHPNYFGEILTWVGMAMIATSAMGSWTTVAMCWISPLWSGFFLLFTSLMLLEKRMDKKFQRDKAYEDYKKRVSVLLLWPARKAKAA